MLTQEQKNKLEPLTKHKRFGKLLIDAMKTWETAIPKQKTYGVTRWVENCEIDTLSVSYTFDPNYNNCCCLIGGALLGKSSNDGYVDSIINNFELVEFEIDCLIKGFDLNVEFEKELNNNEAYRFGKSVSAIIFAK